jgi:hypothetical protein
MASADITTSTKVTDAQGGLVGQWGQIANLSAVGAMMVLLFLVIYWVRSDGLEVVRDFQEQQREQAKLQRDEFRAALDTFRTVISQQQDFERTMRTMDREAVMKLTVAIDKMLEKTKK